MIPLLNWTWIYVYRCRTKEFKESHKGVLYVFIRLHTFKAK